MHPQHHLKVTHCLGLDVIHTHVQRQNSRWCCHDIRQWKITWLDFSCWIHRKACLIEIIRIFFVGAYSEIKMRHWPSGRSRWLDIGKVFFFAYVFGRRDVIIFKKRHCLSICQKNTVEIIIAVPAKLLCSSGFSSSLSIPVGDRVRSS